MTVAKEAAIRGIDIDKLAKGFADEALIVRKYVTNSTTSAREIRWYQKTAGFVAPTTTEKTTSNLIDNTDFGAMPVVAEQSWTRQTSYVRKYFVTSPLFTIEDIKDSDPDIIATHIRDLVRAVERRIEKRIYDVITESDTPSTIQTVAITHEWDDPTNCVPISDMLEAKEKLQNFAYEPNGAIFMMRPDVNRFLLSYIIATKGSSIPQFASDKVESGVIMEILGLKCIVSTIVTSDKAVIFVPQVAATWKEFMPVKAVEVDDPGIGVYVRIWSEGECLLTDPKAVVFFSNIGPT
jgi:hypothetical protein